MACFRLLPHMSVDGCSELQTAGRSGLPNKRQRPSRSSCTQGTPAGFAVATLRDATEGWAFI